MIFVLAFLFLIAGLPMTAYFWTGGRDEVAGTCFCLWVADALLWLSLWTLGGVHIH